VAWSDRDDVAGVVGCPLADSTVGPVGVVVLDVLDEQGSKLVFVPDDGPVEEFVTESPDPPLRERVRLRRPWRCSDRGDAGAGEDRVEGSGELAGAVADQELEPVILAESHHQVAGGLGGPRAGRGGGDPGEMHPSGGVFDDEQDVEPAQKITVSTQAKSVAMIAFACDRRNTDHDGPVRLRVGSMPAVLRIFQTVDAASLWPRRPSSP